MTLEEIIQGSEADVNERELQTVKLNCTCPVRQFESSMAMADPATNNKSLPH